MSIKEIMDRFMRGQKIDDAHMRSGNYDSGASYDSDDLEEVNRMDLYDKEMLTNQIRAENKEKIAFLKKQKQEQKAREDRQRSERAQGGDARAQVRQDLEEWEEAEAKRKADDPIKNPAKKSSRPPKTEPE